jgi:hypothetical protein
MKVFHMQRYAAKLLFQFRVNVDGDSGKRRICEERIINFMARTSQQALKAAKRHGKKGEFSYNNSDGNLVSIEFVGIIELKCFGSEVKADEVWYEIRDRLLPMERRSKIIPTDSMLLRRLSSK